MTAVIDFALLAMSADRMSPFGSFGPGAPLVVGSKSASPAVPGTRLQTGFGAGFGFGFGLAAEASVTPPSARDAAMLTTSAVRRRMISPRRAAGCFARRTSS